MVTKLVCPGCGATDLKPDDENPNKYSCHYCRTTFITDENKVVKKVLQEVKPDPKVAQSEVKRDDTLTDLIMAGVIILVVLLCIGAFGYWIWYSESYSTSVNTIGQYVIPLQRGFSCSAGEPAVAEFGFYQEPPLLKVYPGTEKNHWVIPAEIKDKMDRVTTSVGYVNQTYLWVHCSSVDNKPGFYIGEQSSTNVIEPVDGMEVIFTK